MFRPSVYEIMQAYMLGLRYVLRVNRALKYNHVSVAHLVPIRQL